MENSIEKLEDQIWFQRIMTSEGGLNLKEPASVGSKSYAGASQKAFGDWRKKKCQISDAPYDVEELAGTVIGTEWEKKSPLEAPKTYNIRVDVITAFYEDYFKMARLEILPECLKYIHADFFVNAKFNANKILQRMVGFTGKDVDGILGPASRKLLTELSETIKKDIVTDSTADDDLIMAYHNQKLDHYESLKEVNENLYNNNVKGWRKRAQHVLSELEDYFHDEDPTVSAIHEDDVDPIDLFNEESETNLYDKDKLVSQITSEVMKILPEVIEEALKGIRGKS